MTYKTLLLAAFLGVSSLCADRSVTPTFVARSQGLDGARKLVGVTEKVHQYDAGCYWNFSVMPEYTKSFHDNKIALSLFGDDLVNCNQILIQGSEVADRDAKAWLADYFYLPPDYNSHFSVQPVIQNLLVDLDLYAGLDDVVKGLYVRIHGPLNWTKWNLKFEEPCDVLTTGSYTAGYFSTGGMANNQLLQSFGDYAQGNSPLSTLGTSVDPSIGVSFDGLQYALMQKCSQTRTGFADLRGELGWNFFQCDDYHLGLNVQLAAPTGSKREARFAFDAVVGNGNHWEVGGGLTAHYVFWRAQSEDKHAGFYVDASITHMNQAIEQRTFDLCGKANSRYMLAQKMGPLTTPDDLEYVTPITHSTSPILTAGDTSAATLTTGTAPKAEFDGIFTPVANLTTLNVYVSTGVQADIALMFNYTSNNWGFDLGYDFWVRSCEKIRKAPLAKQGCCPNLCSEKDAWALKGDARVFGFMAASGTALSQGDAVRLSATQCGATIHSGTNADASTDECAGVGTTQQNCGVDNAQFAYGETVRLVYLPEAGNNIAANHIKTSLEPKFINCCDINFQETKGLSNKVFANLGYTWNKNNYTPYLGVGGFAEFGSNQGCNDDCAPNPTFDCGSCDNTSCQTACCSSCIKTSLSQWGVWLKGGVTFN